MKRPRWITKTFSILISLTHLSVDYVGINAGFLNRKGWESEVDKMIKAYGAPIGADDAKTIVEYLTANYGSRE